MKGKHISYKNYVVVIILTLLLSLAFCASVLFGGFFSTTHPLTAVTNAITYNANGGTLYGNQTLNLNVGDEFVLPKVEKIGHTAYWKDNQKGLIKGYNTEGTAISSRAELSAITGNGKYYLTKDIDLSGANWVPLCQETPFTGVLDGNGYTIKNMKINSYQYNGLFGQMHGIVKNLKLTGVSINHSSSTSSYVGAISGHSHSGDTEISNCSVTGTISASASTATLRAGGIMGYGFGVIKNCFVNVNMTSSSSGNSAVNMGGIVGESDSAITIINCYKLGTMNIKGTASTSGTEDRAISIYSGGIIGDGAGGNNRIENCYNVGKITNYASGKNTNASTSYDGKGYIYSGGIMGYGRGSITNCYNLGALDGKSYGYGGDDCYGYCYQAGILGDNTESTVIKNCLNTGNIISYAYGWYNSSSYMGSSYYKKAYAYAGGILGYRNSTTTINNCYNGGNLSATGDAYGGDSYEDFKSYQMCANNGSVTYSGCTYLSTSTMTGEDGTGTNDATAVTTAPNVQNTFYNNMDSSNKDIWSYSSGSTTNPSFTLDMDYSGNIEELRAYNSTTTHTLTAQWTANLYTVAYNGNGATSGSMSSTDITFGQGTKVAKNAFTFSGFSFLGWADTSDAKEPQYADEFVFDTYPVGTNNNGAVYTLYAVWQSTINLDVDGGTGATSVSAIYKADMPEVTTPIRAGYTFGGFFTAKNGAGTKYYTAAMKSAHVNDLPNGTSLYAYWMVNKYILYYNPNGGTVNNSAVSIEFGASVNIQTPSRSGYTFFGWYMNGERYNGGVWTFTENKTVTAKWGYTLTFDPNGGFVNSGSIAVMDGDSIITPTPTREDCNFAGWQIGSTAYNGGLWNFTTNQTAVAQWVVKFTTVLNNGAEGSITGTSSGNYAPGKSVSITATPASGFAFDYWLINTTKVTTATYSGAINGHTTATAYFKKTQPTANVTSTNGTIASTYLNFEPDTYSATLRITPEAGKYVDEISFDNVAYYKIDSWATKLYASSTFAQNVSYQANEGNNDLWLTFSYYNTSKAVNVYVKLTTTKYTNLSMPKNTDGGALDGIAVCANYGGSVTLIGADYETLADSDTIICSAKLAQSGYEFVGWCFYDAQSNILSTEESARFEKFQIYGRQLMAKFQPTADNPNYNMTLDNQ